MVSREDLIGAAVLSAAFIALLGIAELWRWLGNPKAEWTRKLVHLGAGGVCLALPFVVDSIWVVMGMAAAMTAIFTLAKKTGYLQSLHGVGRSSRGAEYYPVAIFLALLFAGERRWLFVAAVLVLAVGDAFAALVGSRYGVIRYEVEQKDKSLEGSLVFLVIAFLAMHLPTLLMTDLPRATTVLGALLVAALVTGVEAISRSGTDNLFIPLAVVIILGKITQKPLPEIVFQNLSLLAICVVMVLLVRKFPLFNIGATIAFILYAYGTWSLGSWQWSLPVFMGLACYVVVWLGVAPIERPRQVRPRTVSRALLPPFAILLIANSTGQLDTYFGAYLAASSAVLALALTGPLLHLETLRRGSRVLAVFGTAVLGCVVTLLPPWSVQPGAPLVVPLAIVAVVVPLTWINAWFESRHQDEVRTQQWSALRLLLCLAAAGVVLLLQIAGVTPVWGPL